MGACRNGFEKEDYDMKLIFAVIRDKDANMAIEGLAQSHIGVTKLASTGGGMAIPP